MGAPARSPQLVMSVTCTNQTSDWHTSTCLHRLLTVQDIAKLAVLNSAGCGGGTSTCNLKVTQLVTRQLAHHSHHSHVPGIHVPNHLIKLNHAYINTVYILRLIDEKIEVWPLGQLTLSNSFNC